MFIDDDFHPYLDQWAYLANVRMLTRCKVESLISKLCKNESLGVLHSEEDNDKLWQQKLSDEHLSVSDVLQEVSIVMANMLFISKEGLSPRALNLLKRLPLSKILNFSRHKQCVFPHGISRE